MPTNKVEDSPIVTIGILHRVLGAALDFSARLGVDAGRRVMLKRGRGRERDREKRRSGRKGESVYVSNLFLLLNVMNVKVQGFLMTPLPSLPLPSPILSQFLLRDPNVLPRLCGPTSVPTYLPRL